MDIGSILWAISILTVSALLGFWYLRSTGTIGKRAAVTALVLAVSIHLLYAHNRLWTGSQALRAEVRLDGEVAELLLVDIGGGRISLESENTNIEELQAQIEARIAGNPDADRAALAIEPGSLQLTSDRDRFVFTIKPEATEADRALIRERLLGSPFRRSNPPRPLLAVNLGIDLRGGVEFIARLYDDNNVPKAADDDVIAVLRERLDNRGLTEPQVFGLSNGDVQIIIPGGTEADAAATRAVLERTGRLEVREVKQDIRISPEGVTFFTFDRGNRGVRREVPGDPSRVIQQLPNGAWTFGPAYPESIDISHDRIYPKATLAGERPTEFVHVGMVALDGRDVEDAAPSTSDGRLGLSITYSAVGGQRNREFTQRVYNDHEANPTVSSGRIAFSLDGIVESDPYIREPSGRHTLIDGRFTREEVEGLRDVLRAGSLSVTPRVLSQQVVGPSLGQETIGKGISSLVWGGVLIFVFMWAYYRRIGFVAWASLGVGTGLIYLALSIFDATLTLPGIAGMVLTIGMAVDANILIFERLREELAKDQIDIGTCIDNAYARAFGTILDSNLTTFITALVLYVIGAGPIKGFGLTLMIGIATSMFGAIYVGRLVTEILVRGGRRLQVPGWIPEIRLPYMRMGLPAIALSVVIAITGMGWFFYAGPVERNFDIDFTGGSLVQMTTDQPMSLDEVRAALAKTHEADPEGHDLTDPATLQIQPYFSDFVAGGSASRQWVIKGRDLQARSLEQDKARIEKSLVALRQVFDGLVEAERSELEEADLVPMRTARTDVDEVVERRTLRERVPARIELEGQLQRSTLNALLREVRGVSELLADLLDERQQSFKDQLRTSFAGHVAEEGSEVMAVHWEGAVLTLDVAVMDAAPALALRAAGEFLTNREELRSVTMTPIEAAAGARPGVRVVVEYATPPMASQVYEVHDRLTKRIADLVGLSPGDTQASARAVATFALYDHVAEALASQRVVVDRPFPSTQHFSPQVGDQMRIAATWAMIISLIAILLYVAARFEFRFGLGAIVALLHDVIITVGLISLIGIRIDLTVIAAILTVIGYGLNDSIVVFDRIRENMLRSKNKLVDNIDLAIAQTMSRSLLTSGTTIMVVAIVYFFGGDGLTSFSATLLVGLVLGSYSSIFIAAPILVFFGSKDPVLMDSTPADDDEEIEAQRRIEAAQAAIAAAQSGEAKA